MPDSRAAAVALAAETIADLMVFWGFRRSMGIVWTALFLHRRPMTQEDLVAATGLSMGMVSMTLADLEHWGVVHRQPVARDRRRFYVAETDVKAMITRVLQERELRKVEGAIRHLTEVVETLRLPLAEASGAEKAEALMMAARAESLLDLARTGEQMLERMVRLGQVDLGPLEDLARRSR